MAAERFTALYSITTRLTCISTVWVKTFDTPEVFWQFFHNNGWEFSNEILHTYFQFVSTLQYKILFNYL